MADEASFFGLVGRKALIIGGGQGMGESTARLLARAGADVVLLDVVPERAERVAAMANGLGPRGIPLAGDVLDDPQIPPSPPGLPTGSAGSTGAPRRWIDRMLPNQTGAALPCQRRGWAKLSSCPSGSVRWKKRSPHSASRGAVSG